MNRYKKVVEWEKDDFGFFITWLMLIFLTIFFPIVYIMARRKVTYIKITEKEDKIKDGKKKVL